MSIEDELYEITEATNDDGTVDVTIERLERVGDSVEVYFTTPTREEHFIPLEWPDRDSEKYAFVRLCHEADLDLRHAMQLEGSTVRAKKDGDRYTFHLPKDTTEGPSDLVAGIGLVLFFPVMIAVVGTYVGSPMVLVAYIVLILAGASVNWLTLGILTYLSALSIFLFVADIPE